jgi:uncharacterized protein involved in exopolysaccharide biosynthesis/Mrp family chromosome partitioning ATPase
MELRLILEIIWRRRRVVIVTFLAIVGAAILALKLLPPIYKSSLKILSEKPFAEDYIISSLGLPAITTGAGMSSSATADDGSGMGDVLTQATAAPILQTVIDRLQLRDSKGRLMSPDKIIDAPFLSLSSTVVPYFSVDDDEDSNILEVEAEAGDRDEAAMMANDLAAAIIEASIQDRRDGYAQVRRFLEAKIEGVDSDYQKALAEIEAYKLSEKTVDLDLETQALITKLTGQIKEKEDLLVSLGESRAREDVIRRQLQKETPDALSASAIADNTQIAELKRTLSDLEVDLASLLKQKTEAHPDVQLQKAKIQAVSEKLAHELTTLQTSSSDLQDLERLVAATQANIEVLDQQIKVCTSDLYALPGKASDFAKLSTKLLNLQSFYSTFSQRLYELNLADSMTVPCLRVIGPAVASDIDDPASPSKAICAVLGVFLGLFFGLALAFIIEYIDDSVRSLADFSTLDARVLGVIPAVCGSGCIDDAKPRASKKLSEPLRMLAGNLSDQGKALPKVIVVTSTERNEGKTATAANLALVLSAQQRVVTLVDLSSKSHLIQLLGRMNPSSTPEKVETEAYISFTFYKRFTLIVPRSVGPIAASAAQALVEQLAPTCDALIVDTDAVSYSSDTATISRFADLAILVVHDGKNSTSDLKQAIVTLKGTGAKSVGLIPLGYGPSFINRLIRFVSDL